MLNIDKLKSLTKEKGWSLSYVCSKLNVSTSYFNDIRKGKAAISPERLQQISDILDTTPEYLTDQTDIKKRQSENEPDWRNESEKEILNWIKTLDIAKTARLLEIARLIELPDRDYEKISEVIRLFLDTDK